MWEVKWSFNKAYSERILRQIGWKLDLTNFTANRSMIILFSVPTHVSDINVLRRKLNVFPWQHESGNKLVIKARIHYSCSISQTGVIWKTTALKKFVLSSKGKYVVFDAIP